MSHAMRRTLPARRWLVPVVDPLEARALMNATTVTHPGLVHAQVVATEKVVHAEKAVPAAKANHVAAHPVSAVHSSKHLTAARVGAAQLKIYRKDVQALTNFRITPLAHHPKLSGNGPFGGLAPAQVAGAYGVTALGVANQGQGQTIGIIDEFDDPNITSDANTFSTLFNLPKFNTSGGPTLTVTKDTALGPVPSAAGTGVGIETSLDVEWAHAMAPKANILLVEVPGGNDIVSAFVALLSGIQYAASHGASVVSLSYGYHEENSLGGYGLPALYTLNQTYLNSSPTNSIAVTVSTGDSSYPGYPGTSPNVIGVGGTSLQVTASNGYGSEAAWGSTATNPYDGAGGGGPTAFFKAPTFQSGNTVTIGGRYRTVPDVALLADPSTGVSVYDSLDVRGGWTVVGGTSLASPLFAGMLSITQQQRVAAGKAILNTSQIQNDLYSLYNSANYLTYFHDITAGANADNYDGYAGYKTTTGYDLATGLGSPIANNLIPYLASLP